MKSTVAVMKKEMKTINIDAVEDVADDMNDLLEDANEMQEVLSRSYGVCPEVGDEELEAGQHTTQSPIVSVFSSHSQSLRVSATSSWTTSRTPSPRLACRRRCPEQTRSPHPVAQ